MNGLAVVLSHLCNRTTQFPEQILSHQENGAETPIDRYLVSEIRTSEWAGLLPYLDGRGPQYKRTIKLFLQRLLISNPALFSMAFLQLFYPFMCLCVDLLADDAKMLIQAQNCPANIKMLLAYLKVTKANPFHLTTRIYDELNAAYLDDSQMQVLFHYAHSDEVQFKHFVACIPYLKIDFKINFAKFALKAGGVEILEAMIGQRCRFESRLQTVAEFVASQNRNGRQLSQEVVAEILLGMIKAAQSNESNVLVRAIHPSSFLIDDDFKIYQKNWLELPTSFQEDVFTQTQSVALKFLSGSEIRNLIAIKNTRDLHELKTELQMVKLQAHHQIFKVALVEVKSVLFADSTFLHNLRHFNQVILVDSMPRSYELYENLRSRLRDEYFIILHNDIYIHETLTKAFESVLLAFSLLSFHIQPEFSYARPHLLTKIITRNNLDDEESTNEFKPNIPWSMHM